VRGEWLETRGNSNPVLDVQNKFNQNFLSTSEIIMYHNLIIEFMFSSSAMFEA
jgi:hypothetical protein